MFKCIVAVREGGIVWHRKFIIVTTGNVDTSE